MRSRSVALRGGSRRIPRAFFEFDRQLQRPAEMLDERLLQLVLCRFHQQMAVRRGKAQEHPCLSARSRNSQCCASSVPCR
jgi:hypothetical protein